MENVCEYLAANQKSHCCILENSYTEVNRTVIARIDDPKTERVKFVKVDGCLITGAGGRKCDCLVLYKRNNSKMHVMYVEMKGGSAKGSFAHAIDQLENTIKHDAVKAVIASHGAISIKRTAVLHAGYGMTTNRPHNDEVEDRLGMRLHIHRAKQSEKALDLTRLPF
jgi:hypothetical protein